MLVVRHNRYGSPDDVLEVVEEESPVPAAHEVVVAVNAAPVHLADLYNINGYDHFRPPLPATPGYEGVGTVRIAGKGVTNFTPGDSVLLPAGCGSWREEIGLPADGLLPAPQGNPLHLALAVLNPPTASLILEDFGNLKPGDWLIQNAANSNTGMYLIQLARLRGIKTVNVVRRQSAISLLDGIGADVVLTDGPDLAKRVKRATDGAFIFLGIDAVAGAATSRIADCVADSGTVLNYGCLSHEPCQVLPQSLFLRDIRLRGFYLHRQLSNRSRAERAEIQASMAKLIATGRLNTKIAASYPLTEVKTAVAHAARAAHRRQGKIILVPNRRLADKNATAG